MQTRPVFSRVLSVLLVSVMLLASNIAANQRVAGQTTRTGAWLDSVEFSVGDGNSSLFDIRSGTIDMYFDELNSNFYNTSIPSDPSLDVSTSSDLNYELTINPAAFSDTSRINPFDVPEIREAFNWLIDRNYLAQTIFRGLAVPRYFPIATNYPDYQRYASTVSALETAYAYNPTLAESTITTEMLALGAVKVGDIWHYSGSPVTIILLIRNDSNGLRIPMGDYVADQLESIGFVTDRRYLSSSEASPIWIESNPAEGLWHIYTGAWALGGTRGGLRDEGDSFEFYLSPNSAYGFSPLWQAYDPSDDFQDAMGRLTYHQYTDLNHRDALFELCLEESMSFAVRIWLIDGIAFTPRRATTTISNHNFIGIGSELWPFTARFNESEGGNLKVGQGDLFISAWNPIAGSNSTYDQFPIHGTWDHGLVLDPQSALPLPQRVGSAEVFVVGDGSKYQVTEDWVTLTPVPSIIIPLDAWAGWDAVTKELLPISTVYPGDTMHALVKSVVTYPADMFSTVTWHDGSPLSLGDFVYNMILPNDRSNPASPIYDQYDENISPVLGDEIIAIRITSNNPLVIETYTNRHAIDAEDLVYDWWPEGDWGPSPWHTTALAAVAEENGSVAFSPSKADNLTLAWTNYLYGPSIDSLATYMGYIAPDGYIPYAPTMGDYITPTEAGIRWANLYAWYTAHGHFWVGSGPFFVDTYDWDAKTLTLTRFADFPDPSDKWDAYQEGSVHVLAVDYTTGAPGSTFSIIGQNYPPSVALDISINNIYAGTVMTDTDGAFSFEVYFPVETVPGFYLVTVSFDALQDANPAHVQTAGVVNTLRLLIDSQMPVRDGQLPGDALVSPVTEPINELFLPLIAR